MAKSRILIVEDDLDLREALRDTLVFAKQEVVEASNGSMALEMLENEDIKMVVSDVQMAGMDGHTLLKQIKLRYPDMPWF